MKQLDWVPPEWELKAGKKRLRLIARPWALRRLELVEALREDRGRRDIRRIARRAGVRPARVSRFCERWQRSGMDLAIGFGRPRALRPDQLVSLATILDSSEQKTPYAMQTLIKSEFGPELSLQAIRGYCRRLSYRPLRANAAEPRQPRFRSLWSPEQVRELEQCKSQLAQAVLEVGRSQRPLLQIADAFGLPEVKLRRCTNRFAKGGVAGLGSEFPKKNALEKAGLWDAFCAECDGAGNPAGETAQAIIQRLLGRPMCLRSVHNHLRRWKRRRNIPIPKRAKGKKLKPGEGLEVRHPFR